MKITTLQSLFLLPLIFFVAQAMAQSSCPVCPDNLSFEKGDFSGWKGIYGNYVFPIPTPVNNPDFKYQPAGTGTPAQRYEIMSGAGTDPNVTVLPVKSPCGGNYSVRLGFTGNPESQGTGNWPYYESLTYNLRVTQQTAGFTYMYAVVLVDGSHDKFTQPEFDVIMMKTSDSTVLPCGQFSIYAGNGSSDFKNVGNFQYTEWSAVTTDLSNYIGQEITIIFRVRDCLGNLSSTNGNYTAVSGGGHQGYAYIDAYCGPIAQLNYPEFCNGDASLKLCAPPGYKSYSWPAGQPGLPGSPTTQCVTVTNPVEGTKYTVNMMSFGGCPVSVTIPIQGIPTTSSADTIHACAGDTDTLKVQATGNGGPYTYSWSHGLGSGTTAIVTTGTTTTYTVTITNAKNCSSKKQFTVIVDPCKRELELNGGNVCAGDSVLLTPVITGAVAPLSYNWVPGASTNSTLWAKPAVTTTYTLTVTDATGFAMTDTATVFIRLAPSLSVNSDTICVGQNAEFTATGADSYTWPAGFTATGNKATITPTTSATYTLTGTTKGCVASTIFHVVVNTAFSITVNSAQICNGDSVILKANGAMLYTWLPIGVSGSAIKVSPSASTTYTVIGTDQAGGCADTTLASVSVNPLPVVSVNSPEICAGETAQLTASGVGTYVWSPGITPTGVNTAVATPASTTTYTLTGTQNSCSDTVLFSVIVKPSPQLNVNATSVCSGDTAKLTVTGAQLYEWSPPQYLSSTTDSVVFANPPVTATYVVKGTTNSCSDTVMITVQVNAIPDVIVNSPQICNGETAILIANGAQSYTWSPGAVVIGPDKATVKPVVTTTYTVTGYKANCKDSAISTVSVKASPLANFNGPFEGCAPLTVQLLDSSLYASEYSWNLGDGSVSTLKDPLHNYQQPGNYTVTLMVKNAGCTDTLQKINNIRVYPIAKAILTVDKEEVFESNPRVTFSDQSIHAQKCYLDFGDGTSLTNCDFRVEHLYKENKNYCAVLVATTDHACADTTEVCIEVKPETTFYVPNSFTLNDDGKNEFFKAYGTHILEFRMWIFNRWGEKIFESNDLNIGWNGRVNNNAQLLPVQQDVYVCRIIYKDMRLKDHYYYGTVTVVK